MDGMTTDPGQPSLPSLTERIERVGKAYRAFTRHTRECDSTCQRGVDCATATPLKEELREARDAAGFVIPVL